MKKTSTPCYFQCYLDNETLLNHLDDEQAGALWKALFSYANRKEDREFSDPLVAMPFDVMKAQIDRDFAKYEEKCEKYRQNVKKRYQKSESENDSLPSYAIEYDSYQEEEKEEEEKEKDNEKEEEKENASSHSLRIDAIDKYKIELVVNSLNKSTGADFNCEDRAIQRLIAKRLSDGYKIADFFSVIEHKCGEWSSDSEKRSLLCPKELFSDRFEIYLKEAKLACEAK